MMILLPNLSYALAQNGQRMTLQILLDMEITQKGKHTRCEMMHWDLTQFQKQN